MRSPAIPAFILLALTLASSPCQSDQADEQASAKDNSGHYQTYLDAVRAQRRARVEARRRAMQEASEIYRKQGKARHKALQEQADVQYEQMEKERVERDKWLQFQEPATGYWDNPWYYRGY